MCQSFYLMDCTFDVLSMKSLYLCHKNFLLFFLIENVTVSHFTFWSLIHFELFFIYFERLGWRLLFYIWIPNFFSTLFIAKSMLLTLNGLGTYVKKKKTIYVCICIWTLYSVSLIYMSIFMPTPHQCVYCSF